MVSIIVAMGSPHSQVVDDEGPHVEDDEQHEGAKEGAGNGVGQVEAS